METVKRPVVARGWERWGEREREMSKWHTGEF